MEEAAMAIYKLLASGTFDERETQILIAAFEEALCVANAQDRAGPRANLIARRVLAAFQEGESIATIIAKRAAETRPNALTP